MRIYFGVFPFMFCVVRTLSVPNGPIITLLGKHLTSGFLAQYQERAVVRFSVIEVIKKKIKMNLKLNS